MSRRMKRIPPKPLRLDTTTLRELTPILVQQVAGAKSVGINCTVVCTIP